MPRPEALKTYNHFAYAMHGDNHSGRASRSATAFPFRIAFSVTPTVLLNMLLLLLAGGFLAYYVVTANSVVADTYRIKMLKEEAIVLVEQNSSLVADKTQLEDPSSLAEFARAHQMVEAKDVTHLFGNGSVALGGN